jgi:hypothetical protein
MSHHSTLFSTHNWLLVWGSVQNGNFVGKCKLANEAWKKAWLYFTIKRLRGLIRDDSRGKSNLYCYASAFQ